MDEQGIEVTHISQLLSGLQLLYSAKAWPRCRVSVLVHAHAVCISGCQDFATLCIIPQESHLSPGLLRLVGPASEPVLQPAQQAGHSLFWHVGLANCLTKPHRLWHIGSCLVAGALSLALLRQLGGQCSRHEADRHRHPLLRGHCLHRQQLRCCWRWGN